MENIEALKKVLSDDKFVSDLAAKVAEIIKKTGVADEESSLEAIWRQSLKESELKLSGECKPKKLAELLPLNEDEIKNTILELKTSGFKGEITYQMIEEAAFKELGRGLLKDREQKLARLKDCSIMLKCSEPFSCGKPNVCGSRFFTDPICGKPNYCSSVHYDCGMPNVCGSPFFKVPNCDKPNYCGPIYYNSPQECNPLYRNPCLYIGEHCYYGDDIWSKNALWRDDPIPISYIRLMGDEALKKNLELIKHELDSRKR